MSFGGSIFGGGTIAGPGVGAGTAGSGSGSGSGGGPGASPTSPYGVATDAVAVVPVAGRGGPRFLPRRGVPRRAFPARAFNDLVAVTQRTVAFAPQAVATPTTDPAANVAIDA